MGGTRMKIRNFDCPRLTTARHAALTKEFASNLRQEYRRVAPLPYLKDKETHGDVDILVADQWDRGASIYYSQVEHRLIQHFDLFVPKDDETANHALGNSASDIEAFEAGQRLFGRSETDPSSRLEVNRDRLFGRIFKRNTALDSHDPRGRKQAGAFHDGRTCGFAIPLAQTCLRDEPNLHDKYVQLDVRVMSARLFDWLLAVNSYGDVRNILNLLLRRLGLVVEQDGLVLRLPMIDDCAKQKVCCIAPATLELTYDWGKTLEFLGLDKFEHDAGFHSEQDIANWFSKGRFIHREALNEGTFSKTKRVLFQRRKMVPQVCHMIAKTPMKGLSEFLKLHGFVDHSFTSQNAADPKRHGLEIREIIAQEAVGFFGKQSEYAKLNEMYQMAVQWRMIEHQIPKLRSFPEKSKIEKIGRALKRWTKLDQHGCLYINYDPGDLDLAQNNSNAGAFSNKQILAVGLSGKNGLLAWVEEHADELHKLESWRGQMTTMKQMEKRKSEGVISPTWTVGL